MLNLTREQCCDRVQAAIHRATGDAVYSGPFAGMRMTSFARPYYLLGTYELELHPVLGELKGNYFDSIINVGAGDGYYAVGFASLLPRVKPIVVFELLPGPLGSIIEMAKRNGCAARIIPVSGRCGQVELNSATQYGDNLHLVFMDCEGDEKILLDPTAVPGLRYCHIIVELHEFIHKGITEEIRGRFSASHNITEVWSRPRTLADLPFTPDAADFTDELKPFYVQTIDENRPVDMPWFYMEPKA